MWQSFPTVYSQRKEGDIYLHLLFFVSTQEIYFPRPFIIKQNAIGRVLVSETQQKKYAYYMLPEIMKVSR